MIRFVVSVLAGLLVASGTASAGTERIAVVVGNNVGLGVQPPLRYAESDAAKIAQVLIELGGVASDNLTLLRGESLAQVRHALDALVARVVALRAGDRTTRVLLIFYFSGHSDGLGPQGSAADQYRPWNSVHENGGCNDTAPRGGGGRIYCFAAD